MACSRCARLSGDDSRTSTVRAGSEPTRSRTVLATAAVSLLNPYAWIDTVLLLGTVIVSHARRTRAVCDRRDDRARVVPDAHVCAAHAARGSPTRSHGAMLDCFVAVMMLGFAVRFAIDALQASAAR